MKLARFWARGKGEVQGLEVIARGWSDESPEAARVCAGDVARRIAERLISHPDQRNQYQYDDRPLLRWERGIDKFRMDDRAFARVMSRKVLEGGEYPGRRDRKHEVRE